MKNRAFTLIEVLVVVLIIGILAAISVVQYQKSVLKSRFTALMPITKALYEGEELFAMSSGKYTDKLENLDISTTSDASGSTANINGSIVTLGVNNRHTYVKATRENFDNNLIMFQKGSRYFPGEIHCEAKEGKTLANWLCEKELGGEKLDRSLTEGYNDYVINGDGNGVFPKDWVDPVNYKEFMPGDTCTGTEEWGCYRGKISDSECYGENSYTCRDNTFVNSTCNGFASQSCANSSYTNSSCVANGSSNCIGSSFLNSTCKAASSTGVFSCTQSNFDNSICEGDAEAACMRSTFTDSKCYGNSGRTCVGSTFKGNSICYANVEGACGDYIIQGSTVTPAVYEGNACCKGTYCPGNAPKCDCGIDSSTGQHALSC